MDEFENINVNQTFGGAWTAEKLETLTRYLDAYNQALKNQKFTRIYIDGFSGSGTQRIKKDENFESIVGSAICALESTPAFDKFIFVEKKPDFLAKLKDRVNDRFSDKKDIIDFHNKDFNEIIPHITSSIDWKSSRAVLFIDPYATELNWESLNVISETEAIDVWYLFPLSAVTRILPNNQIPKNADAVLKRMFGDKKWQNKLYEESDQLSLFDEFEKDSFRVSQTSILRYAKLRFEDAFPHVSSPKILHNSKGSPLFALFFFCSNPNEAAIGLSSRIANHLLEKQF